MKLRLFFFFILFGSFLFSETATSLSCAQEVVSPTAELSADSSNKENARCIAITKSGKQCKRKSTPGSDFCKQHEKIAEKKRKNNEQIKTIRDEKGK